MGLQMLARVKRSSLLKKVCTDGILRKAIMISNKNFHFKLALLRLLGYELHTHLREQPLVSNIFKLWCHTFGQHLYLLGRKSQNVLQQRLTIFLKAVGP